METKQQISCMKNVSYKKDKDEPLLAESKNYWYVIAKPGVPFRSDFCADVAATSSNRRK